MIKADKIHKERVVTILSACFETNKTVNWIVKQDAKRKQRIRDLIDYSFESCIRSGHVYLTDNKDGVIMCSFSDNKLPILEEALLTLQFVLNVSGIEGLGRAMRREEYIKQFHPQDEEFIYVWFIGIEKNKQGQGIGSALLQEVIEKSSKEKLPVYIETSVEANLPFYQKNGFEIFHISDDTIFGFKLYFLRRFSK